MPYIIARFYRFGAEDVAIWMVAGPGLAGTEVVPIRMGSETEVVALKLSPQELGAVVGKEELAKAAPASFFISPKNSDKLFAV